MLTGRYTSRRRDIEISPCLSVSTGLARAAAAGVKDRQTVTGHPVFGRMKSPSTAEDVESTAMMRISYILGLL